MRWGPYRIHSTKVGLSAAAGQIRGAQGGVIIGSRNQKKILHFSGATRDQESRKERLPEPSARTNGVFESFSAMPKEPPSASG